MWETIRLRYGQDGNAMTPRIRHANPPDTRAGVVASGGARTCLKITQQVAILFLSTRFPFLAGASNNEYELQYEYAASIE